MARVLKGLSSLPWHFILPAFMGAFIHIAGVALTSQDFHLYHWIAQMDLSGESPYNHGRADLPPLKIGFFTFLEWTDLWYVWWVFVEYALVSVLLFWLIRAYRLNDTLIYLGILFYVMPSVFWWNWYEQANDKAIYPTFLFLLMSVAEYYRPKEKLVAWSKVFWLSLILGLMAAYSGIGAIFAPLLFVYLFLPAPNKENFIRISALFAIAAVIVIGTHALYFPDWTKGYEIRIAKTFLNPTPSNVSFMRVLDHLGLYSMGLPKILYLFTVLFAFWKYLSGSTFATCMAITFFGVLAPRPEASYDVVLAAFLPIFLVLLGKNRTLSATILVFLGGVGTRIGFDDAPKLKRLLIMWAPILAGFAYVALNDLTLNLKRTRQFLASRFQRKEVILT